MPHIAEQQRGWQPEHTLSVAEAIKEAMDTTSPPRRSKSMRRGRPSVESPRDLPAPEPHLPLRKASAQGRMQQRKGSVPKPLFAPPMNAPTQSQLHQLRGFNPSPVQQPIPHIDNLNASSEHAFAGREPRRPFKPALDILEDQQQTVVQYAEMRAPAIAEPESNRPPSSPLMPPPTTSPMSPTKRGKSLKSSRSVGDGLRSIRQRVSSKHHKDMNGRLTPDSFTTARPSPLPADEVRESFRSALTSHSSLAHTSTNTTHTSLSSRSESFVKVRREDWDEGGLTDVDMSVEDAIGMYENGFESGAGSAKGSLDIRSIRSADVGRATPEARSIRSLQMDRPTSQPQPQPQPPPPKAIGSQPSTPTKLRPNPAHRRSQSASILILGVPRAPRVGSSPSPSLRAPEPAVDPKHRTSIQIVSNDQSRPGTGAAAATLNAVPRDRYGFKKATQHVTVEQYDAWNEGYSRTIERRSKKWHTLMRSYGYETSPAIRFPAKSEKMKRYVRKGIPPEFRGAAWFWYAGGPGKLAREPGLYWELVEKAKSGSDFLTNNDREHIERDLHRTFPDNIRFKPDPSTMSDAQAGAGGGDDGSPDSKKKQRRATKEPETPILKCLRRVLQAFAIHNPQIGYCQSLNFIAGLLLIFLDEDEEKAFVLLDVVTSTHLPGTHGVALEGANVDIAVLMSFIKDSLPGIWNKLDDKGGEQVSGGIGPGAGNLRLPTVSLATTAWFMSLFVGTLPIESVLRVWDCLFFEGSKTLFRVALSIFRAGESQILKVSDPMEIFQVVQTIPRGMLDSNGLMSTCFARRGRGFGGVSQGLVEKRREDRRRVVKEGIKALGDEEGALRRLRTRLRRGTGKM